MNCYKCKKIIEKMHNDCINDNELQSVLHHINECESCNAYYIVMEQMVDDLKSLQEQELPKGFHNRIHFALKREVENPQKRKKRIATGIKAAAIAACSIILVAAAVSILPRQKAFDSILPNMAMEEIADEPMNEMLKGDIDTEEFGNGYPETESDSSTAAADNGARNTDGQESQASDTALTEEFDASCACNSLVDGGSMVLILDVEDIDKVYEDLLKFIPNPLPDTSWVIDDYEEPSEYRQLRTIMDITEAKYISKKIALEYVYDIELYSARLIRYDSYQAETADLQNKGYVYIVIE